jgi:hypothetical protein
VELCLRLGEPWGRPFGPERREPHGYSRHLWCCRGRRAVSVFHHVGQKVARSSNHVFVITSESLMWECVLVGSSIRAPT